MKISMKLFYQHMAFFVNLSPTSSHLYSLQVANCDSNSRLVVDEDDNVNLGLKGLNSSYLQAKGWIVKTNIRRHLFWNVKNS